MGIGVWVWPVLYEIYLKQAIEMDDNNKPKTTGRELIYIEKKIDQIMQFLFDNKDLGSLGAISVLRKELSDLKKEFDDRGRELEILKDELVQTKLKQVRYNVYVIIMWASLGGVAMAIFLYVLNTVLSHGK